MPWQHARLCGKQVFDGAALDCQRAYFCSERLRGSWKRIKTLDESLGFRVSSWSRSASKPLTKIYGLGFWSRSASKPLGKSFQNLPLCQVHKKMSSAVVKSSFGNGTRRRFHLLSPTLFLDPSLVGAQGFRVWGLTRPRV